MGKRHNEPEPSSSRNTMIVLAAGGVLVAALVIWALTRQVEPAAPAVTSTFASGASQPAPDAGAPTATPPGAPVQTESIIPGPSTTTAIDPNTGVARVSAEDLKLKFDAGNVLIIDVRDQGSYQAGHITGAMHIPFNRVEAEMASLPKDKEIVTYCSCPAEETSGGAALILQRGGFAKVAALYGGYNAWHGMGYPTQTGG